MFADRISWYPKTRGTFDQASKITDDTYFLFPPFSLFSPPFSFLSRPATSLTNRPIAIVLNTVSNRLFALTQLSADDLPQDCKNSIQSVLRRIESETSKARTRRGLDLFKLLTTGYPGLLCSE